MTRVKRARYYQLEAVERLLEFYRHHRAALLLMATGLGKTFTLGELIRRWRRRGAVLVLEHRRELVEQTEAAIRETNPGLPVHVEMGERRAPEGSPGLFDELFVDEGGEPYDSARDLSKRAVVATVQTLSLPRRLHRYDPTEVSLVVIDEGHHYTLDNDTYASIVARFPHAKVLLLTATMDRSDGYDLGNVVEGVPFRFEIRDAVEAGFLVPVRQQFVVVEGLDFSDIKTVKGDLDRPTLARRMEAEGPLHKVASSCLEASGYGFAKNGGQWRLLEPPGDIRQGIVFSPSVDHARAVADVMNRWRPGTAAAVWGEMPDWQRKKAVDDFRAGRLPWLTNYGVLTEGFNAPDAQIIAMARPTKSRQLYAQMIGRGTRTHPSIDALLDAPEYTEDGARHRHAAIASSRKPYCLVLDYVGNSGRHSLAWSGELFTEAYDEKVVLAARERAIQIGGPVDIKEMLEEAAQYMAEEQAHRELDERRLVELKGKANWRGVDTDAFDVFGVQPVPVSPDPERATAKQKAFLARQGVPFDHTLTKAEATRLFLEVRRRLQNGLCTFRQANTLKRYGHPTEVSKEEASRIIDGIAAAGWPPPPRG